MSGSSTALVVHESQAEQIVVLALDDDNILSSMLALFDEAMLSAPLRRLCSSTASEWWFASGRFYGNDYNDDGQHGGRRGRALGAQRADGCRLAAPAALFCCVVCVHGGARRWRVEGLSTRSWPCACADARRSSAPCRRRTGAASCRLVVPRVEPVCVCTVCRPGRCVRLHGPAARTRAVDALR